MAKETIQIFTKTRKRAGTVYPGQPTKMFAEIERNKSIRLFGEYNGCQVDISFNLGDQAEYDSYNLIYHGPIVGISNKTVQIKERYADKTHRLDLYTFMWRNYNFKLEEVIARNQETSHYI